MTKKRSISLFVIFAIILVVCLIACFVNFTYPLSIGGKYYSYSNFVSNLKLGEDINNSLRIVYRAEADKNEAKSNHETLLNATMSDLQSIVQAQGYKDVTVSNYLDDEGYQNIIITVGNIINDEDKTLVESLIGNPTSISFSSDTAKNNVLATGKDIKNVTAGSTTNESGELVYYTMIEFKDEIKAKMETPEDTSVYINIGENQLDWKYGITNGMIPLSMDNFESLLDATTFANQIKTGMLDMSLTQISSDMITPSYGSNANILLSIAMVLFVLIAFVFLIVKYRNIGWIACFNLLFFIVIGLFLLQSIPLIHINLAGMVAMLIAFVLAVDCIMSMLEQAKMHYQSETKLYISFKLAQKETLFKTLILHAIILVSGFICLFMPTMAIQSFGWVMLVSSLVSAFTNLALMRLFVKMYLAIDSENGKKCNFHKGGKNA